MPSEIERIKHEIRNAILTLHQSRRTFLQASSQYAKAQIRYYDLVGEELQRIETALKTTPIPEDAL